MRSPGFTLVETCVAVGLAALLLVAAAALALGSRSFAAAADARRFDALLIAGQALAATDENGATLMVEPAGPGVRITLYGGRPTTGAALRAAGLPALIAVGAASSPQLGSPPFSLFLSSGGGASGLAGYPPQPFDPAHPPVVPSQPPCPAGGAIVLSFTTAGHSQRRILPCP